MGSVGGILELGYVEHPLKLIFLGRFCTGGFSLCANAIRSLCHTGKSHETQFWRNFLKWVEGYLLIFAVEECKCFPEQNGDNSLLPHFWNSYIFLFPLSKRLLPSYLEGLSLMSFFLELLRTLFGKQWGSRAEPSGDLQLSELLSLLSPAFLLSRVVEIRHTPGGLVRTE